MLTSQRLEGLEVSPTDIASAAALLAGQVHRTALLRSRTLDAVCGAAVYTKAENVQRSGSFKIRGALHRLHRLTDYERTRGVVAFSSGNHAQALALAGQQLGVDVTVVMPTDTPLVKLEATRGYGANIVTYDRVTEDREVIAKSIADKNGAVVVPPFNDLHIIAGQGTCGWEIAQQLKVQSVVPDVALLPVGGGGLTSGCAIALVDAFPEIKLIGVEPALADDARQSLAAGHIVKIPQPKTVADGVATQAVGTHTFPILSALLDEIVTVSEDEILHTVRFVMERMKQVVEPTGALTTAALLNRAVDVKGKTVISIFCGGNVDTTLLGVLP